MTSPLPSTGERSEKVLWQRIEYALCASLLLGMSILLHRHWGIPVGFDWIWHIEMVHALSWLQPTVDIPAWFYGYHPPLAFLLARLPLLLGTEVIVSVQLVSMASALVTFLALRATLKHLRLLGHPPAIAFLYLACGIPLFVYLSHSVNMDSVVLACASLTLLLSVYLYGPAPIANRTARRNLTIALILVMVSGMLTKFSGVLLLPLPAIVAWAFGGMRIAPRSFVRAASVAVVSVLAVFPYYHIRYALPYGSYFPSNANIMEGEIQALAREERDRAGWRFFTGMLATVTFDTSTRPEWRDMHAPRLIETWKDFWRADIWLGSQTPASKRATILELHAASFLVLLGTLILLIDRRTRRSPWGRLGMVLLLFSLLQIAALVKYTYDYPWGGAILMKGIYVAPVTWLAAYLIAQTLTLPHALAFLPARYRERLQVAFLAVIGLTVLTNYALPVY